MSSKLLEKTSLEQARLIASGDLSSEELTRLYLARIERINPQLNAFVEVYADEAVHTARRKDSMVRAGEDLPPFHGVPTGIKDLNMIRGKRTRFGSRAIIPFWSPFDDTSVSPFRRAGFILIGKLATSELGVVPITEPDIHPPTRNPWNPEHTAGGSSGGSAAAVAARLLPVAHASDGGGSIRIPASFNGIVGLKPARGRLPNQFGLPDRQIIYTTGAVTRTVEEAAVLLDLMAGLTDGKPHWAAAPAEPYAKLFQKRPPKALRIGLTLESPIVKTHTEVRETVLSIANLLGDMGHTVEEVAFPNVGIEEFLPLWRYQIATMPFMRWSRAQPITRWLHEEGKNLKRTDVQDIHRSLENRLLSWFDPIDLWLTPTVALLPPKIGAYPQTTDPRANFFKIAELGAFTASSNVTGQPAISIPAGLSKEGLPIGVQLVGAPQNEALLLQVAREIEVARPWNKLIPPSID